MPRKKNKHNKLATYGKVQLQRKYCPECKEISFVVGNVFQCCDMNIKDVPIKYEKMIDNRGVRTSLSRSKQKEIKEKQFNKCIYCGVYFGTPYLYKNKIRRTKINYDHLLPFSFLQDNPDDNWVDSCNICNGIKSNIIFDSMQDVIHHIMCRIKKKGYIFA